ncbi:uncharacterized protein LOC132280943 [Cornus florida]|uniref:uncharacterized protein LOC132280943 n=1 Tax=Cornus florida TaxID=4283 RepID=UPI0028A2BBAB|nr:uncharacterized protein LOC132280943 [Cornus florida]
MLEDLAEMGLQCFDGDYGSESAFLFSLVAQPTLIGRVIESQKQDPDLDAIHTLISNGEVACRLALPPQMDRVHSVFHVSMLRKYELYPSHVLSWVDVDINEDVSYEEGPVQILDTRQKVLRDKTIPLVKVLWRHHGVEEATWELEQEGWKSEISLESFCGHHLTG